MSSEIRNLIDYNGCPYCKQSVNIYENRTTNLAIRIVDDKLAFILMKRDYLMDEDVAYVKIRYCPICGKKLSKEGERDNE